MFRTDPGKHIRMLYRVPELNIIHAIQFISGQGGGSVSYPYLAANRSRCNKMIACNHLHPYSRRLTELNRLYSLLPRRVYNTDESQHTQSSFYIGEP